MEQFKVVSNENIAITMWDKIKGYQIKGSRSRVDQKQYEHIHKNHTQSFDKNEVNFSNIMFFFYKIEEFYHVTPGKLAGKEVKLLYLLQEPNILTK